MISGIFHVLRTGAPWRDLPERYGPPTTVYNRCNRWAKAGVWLRIFEALPETSPGSLHLIDSSIVRAHQHAAGGKRGGPDHAIGLSRGGLTTKIHAVVDGRGLPVRLLLTPGQASDKTTAPELVGPLRLTGDVVGDRGYFGAGGDRCHRSFGGNGPHPQPIECPRRPNRGQGTLPRAQPG